MSEIKENSSVETIKRNDLETEFILNPGDVRICELRRQNQADVKLKTWVWDAKTKGQEESFDESRKSGISAAKQSINNWRQKLGLEALDDDEMPVIFLAKDDFALAYGDAGGISSEATRFDGFYAPSISQVFVSDKENSLYASSVAYHELIHKYLEIRSFAFFEADVMVVGRQRRAGLMVDKVARAENGEIETVSASGDLLNELGNYLEQWKFIKDQVTGGLQFESQLRSARERFVKDTGFRDVDKMSLSISPKENKSETSDVVFDTEMLAFYYLNSGNDENKGLSNTILFTQLALDMNELCDAVDGKSFGEVLMMAKTKPELQVTLRNMLDEKMGRGFYKRLKESKYDGLDALRLLLDVQRKLAEEKRVLDK